MSDKFPFKDPHNLKREIQDLISFEEKNQLLRLREQIENKIIHKKDSFPEYSRVLSCSFINPKLDPVVPAKDNCKAEGIPTYKQRQNQLSKMETHQFSKGV